MLMLLSSALPAGRDTAGQAYFAAVQAFAHTLLEKGTDRYGPVKTPMWCAVMDTRDFTAPPDGVPTIEGIRPNDRAVGGSNLYHDVATLELFQVLSQLTGNKRYMQGTEAYMQTFLERTQNPETGLLGWGEHLFYDVYADKVRVTEEYASRKFGGMYHEFLANTPPWEKLWKISPERTAKAIAGIRYHFFSPDTETYLFNRHAHWDKAHYQLPEGSQPWIKHSGLYTHAFTFLYAKTKDPQWLRWARGTGNLYWEKRNRQTNLTLSCIGDPRPSTQQAGLHGTALLAYFLFKSYQLYPQETDFRRQALTLLKSVDAYAWNPADEVYYGLLHLDGTPAPDEKTGKPTGMKAWVSGYGTSSILSYGRIAAYFARWEKDPQFTTMARRAAAVARKAGLPAHFVAENLADALHLSLDLYELTREKSFLDEAKIYADLGLEKLWKKGMFARQTDDRYYEAKAGAGNLACGLLRLYICLNPTLQTQHAYDWSI
jgi:hypothetical protein